VEVVLPDGKTVVTDGDSAARDPLEFAGCDVLLDPAPAPISTTSDPPADHRVARDALTPGPGVEVRRTPLPPEHRGQSHRRVQEGFVELGWVGSDLRVGGVDLLVKKKRPDAA